MKKVVLMSIFLSLSLISLNFVSAGNLGDVNNDNRVNLIDISLVSINFGRSVGDANCLVGSYCEKVAKQGGDLSKVDLADLSVVAVNFGRSY